MSDALRPKRILLTGSTGFVGRHFRASAAARWPSAEIVGMSVGVENAADMIAADLLDRHAVAAAFRAVKPDLVVHLAALASTVDGERESSDAWATNVGGTLNLALAVLAHAPETTMLFASSSEVYGASFLRGPVDETTPLLPLSTYAKSKTIAERLLAELLPSQTRLIVTRPFNHTGPGQRESFVLPSFVGQIVRIEAGEQPARLAVGNIDVCRDILDVRDVVDAYLDLIAASPSLPPRFTCNVGSGRPRPLRDHLETLRRLARRDFEIVVDPARLRAIDLPVARGCSRLLQSVTGWSPLRKIEDTLREMLDARRR